MMNFETLEQDILREMAKATELNHPESTAQTSITFDSSTAEKMKNNIAHAAEKAYNIMYALCQRYHSGVDALREGAERDLEALRK